MEIETMFDIVIPFDKNWNNNLKTYEILIKLYHILNNQRRKKILLDFSKLTFISANLLALFGCCLDNTVNLRNHIVAIGNIHPKIKNVMQKKWV